MKSFDHKEIAKELVGKTVESTQIAVRSVSIKFTDGTYLDVDFDNTDQSLLTFTSKE